jgi:molybdopterin-containing oxidoreductase family iron-sulfur binding subunit
MGGVAGAAVLAPTGAAAANDKRLKGKRLGMVIDLQRCTGCGGCVISCVSENNVQTGITWGKKIVRTEGKFPNVRLDFVPTLCNHCDKAPCVRGCPTGAMHKDDGGMTAHNPEKCIGCRTCKAMCPYDVISINASETHRFWRDTTALIKGCTSSAREVVQKVKGDVIPYYN